jgi:hypothetical protein
VLYFANPCSPKVIAAMKTGCVNLIDTPDQGSRTAVLSIRDTGHVWCADNGAFSDKFNEAKWWRFLTTNAVAASTCAFATAPDVVGDAAATLERSLPWLPKIRALGYPAAFVAQDGIESLPIPWDEFDCLFIGGTDEFKLGPHASRVAAEAEARGKWVHMGRVNSKRRFDYARAIGCDSADGTKLVFGPDANLPLVLSWLRSNDQDYLFGGVA